MNYLLDTNIVLLMLRERNFESRIMQTYFQRQQTVLLSVVSLGELRALGIRNSWGLNKYKLLANLVNKLLIIDIHAEDIIQRYAEIDAYSQGKLPNQISNFTARNMGKNDLWIAATASVLGATLLTTDNDFLHLHPTFLVVEKVNRLEVTE